LLGATGIKLREVAKIVGGQDFDSLTDFAMSLEHETEEVTDEQPKKQEEK
jgi:hypothetical protein